ncbi:MAG: hypothetical protein CL484_12160 [Acidobacteria bacterium]|nr:hypothetical protein [Acidobacteriota bacterium]
MRRLPDSSLHSAFLAIVKGVHQKQVLTKANRKLLGKATAEDAHEYKKYLFALLDAILESHGYDELFSVAAIVPTEVESPVSGKATSTQNAPLDLRKRDTAGEAVPSGAPEVTGASAMLALMAVTPVRKAGTSTSPRDAASGDQPANSYVKATKGRSQ